MKSKMAAIEIENFLLCISFLLDNIQTRVIYQFVCFQTQGRQFFQLWNDAFLRIAMVTASANTLM